MCQVNADREKPWEKDVYFLSVNEELSSRAGDLVYSVRQRSSVLYFMTWDFLLPSTATLKWCQGYQCQVNSLSRVDARRCSAAVTIEREEEEEENRGTPGKDSTHCEGRLCFHWVFVLPLLFFSILFGPRRENVPVRQERVSFGAG